MAIRDQIQEMCLALIQVSVRCRRLELRQRLERIAFELLEHGNAGDFQRVAEKLDLLDGFVGFGRMIYEIEPVNAGILTGESARIKSEIRQTAGIAGDGSIARIFKAHIVNPAKERQLRKSKQQLESKANAAILGQAQGESGNDTSPVAPNAAIIRQTQDKSNAAIMRQDKDESGNNAAMHQQVQDKSNAAIQNANAAIDETGKLAAEKNPLNDWANAAIRQSAIVERIRQSGNDGLKLRGIIAEFPGVSDRTVRYDLQKLCSQGILERIGPGGPASSYRVRVI